MAKRFHAQICVLVCVTGFLIAGCSPVEDETFIETQSREYTAGKQKMREGDVEGALDQFLKAIEKYSYSPESHLEAGILYLRHEDEPILSIYHLHRYLEQKPEGREAALVQELILSAKKQFAASLPGNPFKQQVSRMELLETIAALKRQLESVNREKLELEQEVASLSQQLSGTQETVREIFTTSLSGAELNESSGSDEIRSQTLQVDALTEQNLEQVLPEPNTSRNIPETYQVKSGDSLYAISMNFYGDAEHIQTIFQANRNILRSVNDLRPGQVLQLPRD